MWYNIKHTDRTSRYNIKRKRDKCCIFGIWFCNLPVKHVWLYEGKWIEGGQDKKQKLYLYKGIYAYDLCFAFSVRYLPFLFFFFLFLFCFFILLLWLLGFISNLPNLLETKRLCCFCCMLTTQWKKSNEING
jgi:hypothetical protein